MRLKKRVARNIKIARQTSGLSLRQVAQATKIGHATVHNYERGIKEPTVSRLFLLASAMGTTVENLLEGCAL